MLTLRFEQFDSSRTGQLNSYDLQRLLAKDSLMEDPREDAVKMLMSELDLQLVLCCAGWVEKLMGRYL